MPTARSVDPDDLPPSSFTALLEMRRYARTDDDRLFTRALARLWNECVCYDEPVRTWRELQGVPISGCAGAVTGDELALFIALMIGIGRNFAPPPPKKATKKTA